MPCRPAARPQRRRSILLAAAACVAWSPAAAQVPLTAPTDSAPAPTARAALAGRVTGSNGLDLDHAEVTVTRVDGRGERAPVGTRARVGGEFRIDGLAPGRYLMRARALGYEPLYFSATLADGGTRRMDLELTQLPVQLSTVEVREQSGFGFADSRLRDFERRRRAGFGQFFTRDDLKRYPGFLASDVLRYTQPLATARAMPFTPVPVFGTALAASSLGPTCTQQPANAPTFAGGWPCASYVSIDGGPAVPSELAFDPAIARVEAMELYRSTVGAVVVIWTGVAAAQESQ